MTADATVAASEKVKREKTVYTDVKMDDGRVVQFAGKRKMLKDAGAGPDGKHYIRLDFVNGETRTFVIPDEDVWTYAHHGAKQVYGDVTAGEEDVNDMIICVDNLGERLAQHQWAAPREAGEGFSGSHIIIKAMCKVTGKDINYVKAYLEKKLADTNAPYIAEGKKPVLSRQGLYRSLRDSEKFGPAITALEAEKKKAGPKISYEDFGDEEAEEAQAAD